MSDAPSPADASLETRRFVRIPLTEDPTAGEPDLDEDMDAGLARFLDAAQRFASVLDAGFTVWPRTFTLQFGAQPDLFQTASARIVDDGNSGYALRLEVKRIETRLLTFDAWEEGYSWNVRVDVDGLPPDRALTLEWIGIGSATMTATAAPEELQELAASVFALQARPRARTLWGARADEAIERIAAAAARHHARVRALPRAGPLSERDVVVIAYPDHVQRHGERPLRTLARFLDEELDDVADTVHLLPFHPCAPNGYDGYSVTDYGAVDARLGSWADVEDIAGKRKLLVDVVLNHCSMAHPWFRQFVDGLEPGRRYFFTVEAQDASGERGQWLEKLRRARSAPLLHEIATREGARLVWKTYDADLVDLDWREPAVAVEMIEHMYDAIAHGARALRLDAFVYVWKRVGIPSIDLPGNHELLRLLQEALTLIGRDDVLVLPSITNVSHAQNRAYLGESRFLDGAVHDGDLVYQLPLAALLLHALYAHDARALRKFLTSQLPPPTGTAFVNLVASHDGIGLSWLDGLLDGEQARLLVDNAVLRGGIVSWRAPTPGANEVPWEINTTLWSACAPEAGEPAERHAERMLALLSVVLALAGVPALYLSTFFCAENAHDRVRAVGDNRAINRGRFDADERARARAVAGSPEQVVFDRLRAMVRVRRAQPAFAPASPQSLIFSHGRDDVLCLWRNLQQPASAICCVSSFAGAALSMHIPSTTGTVTGAMRDLLSGELVDVTKPVRFAPYQARWLRMHRDDESGGRA